MVDASKYRTHDFRRGHAEDLRLSGAPLAEILKAGDWRSSAFLDYLDRARMETELIIEAHLPASSDDEENAV